MHPPPARAWSPISCPEGMELDMDLVSSGTELMPLGHMAGKDTCLPPGLEAVWAPPSGLSPRDGDLERAWHPVMGHWAQLRTGEFGCLVPLSLVRVPRPRGDMVPMRCWKKIWDALRPPKGCPGGQGELRGGRGRTGEEVPCPHREPWPLAGCVRLCRAQLSLAEMVLCAGATSQGDLGH